MSSNTKYTITFFVVIGLAFIFGLAGDMDMEDAEADSHNYCKMVRLHLESDGRAGWPDYKSSYDRQCVP